MYIKDHQLMKDIGKSVAFVETPNMSGGFHGEGLVLHDTAGRLDPGSSVRWLAQSRASASAHFVIERDGTITQMVPLNKKAWHAGKSSYKDRKNVNRFAWGIEIVNPGKLTGSRPRSWFGQVFDVDKDGLIYEKTAEHGEGWWMPYTQEQIAAVIDIAQALNEAYGLRWITTHWFISPGRKVDTNPLFPLDHVRGAVFGRGDDEDSEGCVVGIFGDAETAVRANMRAWPHVKSKLITTLDKRTRVDVVRSGYFESPYGYGSTQWHLCDIGAQQGWIYAPLIDLD